MVETIATGFAILIIGYCFAWCLFWFCMWADGKKTVTELIIEMDREMETERRLKTLAK